MQRFSLIPALFILTILVSCNKQAAFEDKGLITFNLPYANEIAYTGSSLEIKWQSTGVQKVSIALYQDNKQVYLVEGNGVIENSYSWKIPEDLEEGSNYRLKVSNTQNEADFIFTTKPFTLRKPDATSSFTDSRDGKLYQTVKIGNQWWMAENLRFEPSLGYSCYFDAPQYCETYGKLYTYEAALESCPEGWHLPTDGEWKELETYIGIPEEKLDAAYQRGQFSGHLLKVDGGTGFNALYGGYYNNYHKQYGHRLWEGHFWTASLDINSRPIIRIIHLESGEIHRLGSMRHGGSSVRCIKE